jgi:hypothetical protein
VIPYQVLPSHRQTAILFANKELAAAAEQTPTQFGTGADAQIISLD